MKIGRMLVKMGGKLVKIGRELVKMGGELGGNQGVDVIYRGNIKSIPRPKMAGICTC